MVACEPISLLETNLKAPDYLRRKYSDLKEKKKARKRKDMKETR